MRAVGKVVEPIHMDWDLVLLNRIASILTLAFEQRWAPPNRKTAWLYPEVLLPSDREIEKVQSSILLAIDASGSITEAVLTRLLGLARSIPQDRVDIKSISFDTDAYPFEIWGMEPEILGGGGTSFDAIEAFAAKLSHYPDLIVVLTDGFAPRPNVQHPDRWFWLITQGGSSQNIQGIGGWCLIRDPMTDKLRLFRHPFLKTLNADERSKDSGRPI
jgi:predicted metal-dependent peptidase